MPTTTLILTGYGLLTGMKVKVRPQGGNQGEGEVQVSGGTSPFEPDDIIVVTVDNPDGNNEVTQNSTILGITVYDSAADYYASNPKYTYTDSGGGANIRADTSGLGDNYLRFNGNNMVSTDPGAPALGQVMLAAGVDLTAASSGGTVTMSRFVDHDYDQDGGIDPGTTEVANGLFATENNIYSGVTPVCFARGTLIETPDGPRTVESLAAGDLVNTLDSGAQPLIWTGSRHVPGTAANAPVRILAGALGNVRDLFVSQNHRILLHGATAELLFGENEVLVAAKHLVNDRTIRIVPRPRISYHHFLLDAHHVVFAEACPCESLYLGSQALQSVTPEGRSQIAGLFPHVTDGDFGISMSRYELKQHEARVYASLHLQRPNSSWPIRARVA